MAVLKISQFSCVEDAELELGALTVLIGPQASGKSLICKLLGIVVEFKKWFPPSAWGKKRFFIVFNAGPVSLSLIRTVSGNRPGQNVRLVASDYIKTQFEEYTKFVVQQKEKAAAEKERVTYFDSLYRAEIVSRRRFRKDLGLEQKSDWENNHGLATLVGT
jgi:predicted ATP-dependent endonuclease of OLD family